MFVVVDRTTHTMVALDRSNRVDYTVQRGRLRALCELWQPKQIIAEQNSIGQPVIEQLTQDGLRVQPFITTNASKAQAVDSLALAFERGDIRILNDAVLVSELVAYQAERLPSGLMRYGAPSGQHDDCVMALAIAWTALAGQRRAIYPVPESDLLIDPFEIPPYWPRAYGLDVGGRTTTAIWGALDRQSDILYLYSEYHGMDCQPSVHAQAIRSRGTFIPGVMDTVGNGRNQMDGRQLVRLYQDLGLKLHAASNLVESGTLEVWQRMSTGRLKVFTSLPHYLEELRSYCRDGRDQIVVEGAHLQNATRCLVVSGISRMRTAEVKRWLSRGNMKVPGTSWMGS